MCAKHTTLHNSTHTERETEPRGTERRHTHTERERMAEAQRCRGQGTQRGKPRGTEYREQ